MSYFPRANQSTGNIPQQPYMFGGSGGYSNSSTSFTSRKGQGQESVRDCMYWPLSLGPDADSKSQSKFQGDQAQVWSSAAAGGGSVNVNNVAQSQAAHVSTDPSGGSTITFPPEPMVQQTTVPENYPKAKAFMQGGQGELHPLSIPCQLAPSGASIQPMTSMQPMTIKVTAPSGVPRNGQPMNFQINPYAGLQAQGQRRK